MKRIMLACLLMLIMTPMATADVAKNHDKDRDSFEARFDDLKDRIYDIRYSLLGRMDEQYQTIREQEKVIEEMRLKIKDLEYNLFQTTQSLRNLELEVWDMQESAHSKRQQDE